jgi:hypothetical protein
MQPEVAESWRKAETIDVNSLVNTINLTPERGRNGFGKHILKSRALAIDIDTDNGILYGVCNPEARKIYSGKDLLNTPTKEVHQYI